jgi:glycosyltransferase involved in cell wall biosynthesis
MKILTLNYEYPPLGGGAGLITQQICKGLSDLGHQISVITAGMGNTAGICNENGVEIIRLASERKAEYQSNVREMLSWIKHAKKAAAEYCASSRPDIIFAHFSLPGGEVARTIQKSTGIPYVIMSHGHDIPWFDPAQMFFYHLATYCRIKNIYRHSSALFLQSEFTKQNADRFSGKKYCQKNIIIPNGCDNTVFPPVQNNFSGVLRLYTGGRMVSQKEPATLLKALAIIKSEGIRFHLTLAGDGPLLPSLKKFCISYGLVNDVTFTGWLRKNEIPEQLRKTDVFVLPSRAEGMSISLLEALCSGVWAVVTPVSGNTDLVEEGVNGNFFPVKDYHSLAAKLIDFSRKLNGGYPLKKEVTVNFREKYCWKSIAKKYEAELIRIIS